VIYHLLRESNEPAFWTDLVERAKLAYTSNIRVLRRDFRDLKRSGRIYRDEKGSYSLIDLNNLLNGVVTKTGSSFCCEGYELVADPKIKVRVGDEIEGFLLDSKFVLTSVRKLSKKPVIGVISLAGPDYVVESLSPDLRGKIFLSANLTTQTIEMMPGDTVEVELVDRVRQGFTGKLLRKIEGVSLVGQAISTTIENYDIPLTWPDDLEQSVNSIRGEISKAEYETRMDLTSLPFVTIDGETAKDFDDAVYAERLNDQSWRILVAIADVCHYVKAGSPMDMEARKRGTSVYFPGTVVPMLPERLSTDLCSLKQHCDRPVLVCEMSLNSKGVLEKFKFYEALICSKARLTYNEVHAYLSDQTGSKQLTVQIKKSLGALHSAYLRLAERRFERGALDFSTNEAALELSNGAIQAIGLEEKHEAHKLIEEMMLLTNVCAAKFLEEKSRRFLYRNHEQPDLLKLEQLKQTLSIIGFSLEIHDVSSKAIQELLVRLLDRPKGEIYQQLVLKSLRQAVYESDNKGHFGLALDAYTHFTSPIRRYPDLLAHRSIKSILDGSDGSDEYSYDDLVGLGISCSEAERRAEFAGWAVDTWLKCDYLLSRVGDTVEGWIAGVTDFGLFIELSGYFVQGLLHITNLGDDYYKFYPNSSSLVGASSGRVFRFGESINVKISNIEPAQGKIELQLVQGEAVRKGRRKERKRRRGKRERLS